MTDRTVTLRWGPLDGTDINVLGTGDCMDVDHSGQRYRYMRSTMRADDMEVWYLTHATPIHPCFMRDEL